MIEINENSLDIQDTVKAEPKTTIDLAESSRAKIESVDALDKKVEEIVGLKDGESTTFGDWTIRAIENRGWIATIGGIGIDSAEGIDYFAPIPAVYLGPDFPIKQPISNSVHEIRIRRTHGRHHIERFLEAAMCFRATYLREEGGKKPLKHRSVKASKKVTKKA